MTSTILVTGATGNVGTALTGQLRAHDVHVRSLPREPRPMDRATLARATDGVDAVFLACGNVPEQVEFECAVIDASAQAGVRRIVKLSARGADPAAAVAYWRWHAEIERHLAASGVPSVVLQPGFFMTNLLGAVDHVRQAGMLFAPAGQTPIAMTDPADVADVAAVALTSEAHDGATYVLTGPAAISYDQVATDLSAAVRRSVGYTDVPPEAARASLAAAGLPPFAVDQLIEVFAALRRGEQAEPTDTVPSLTERPARPFAAWAETYAEAFGRTPASVVG